MLQLFEYIMVHIKFPLWENFIENNRNKEEHNKNVKQIGDTFLSCAPDTNRCWEFLVKKHGLCLMMKNITKKEEFVLLHSFHNVSGFIIVME